ncbi:DUF2142 domain-containing protein [Luteibacter pinisoli]|nr:DUF2142 domain-containing protein [Luteibacter pinisoli]
MLLALFVISAVIAALTPPFSAPDEFDHIQRAYMIGQGQLLLHSVHGSPSGGAVDTGMLEFMDVFGALPHHKDQKISATELARAGAIRWAGKDTFVAPAPTAYYFPALYAPEAVALSVSKGLGLSVSSSYQLARLAALVSCILLLSLACRIYPPPAAMLAILALPMNLFLVASPTLDGMATSVAALCLATFMRLSTERGAAPRWVFWTFAASLFLLATCRANAAPFLLLAFAVWWFLRDRRSMVVAVALSVLVVTWTLLTIRTTVYPPGPHSIDHGMRLASYLIHPFSFFEKLYATLANPDMRGFYFSSFIGTLGWLDTSLSASTYAIFGVLLLIAAAFSFSPDDNREQRTARVLLVICAIGMVLMTYLAMLVQWTAGDSPIIRGVQGRYFTIPALALAFAIGAGRTDRFSALNRVAIGAAAVILLIATFVTPQALAARYLTQDMPAGDALRPALVLTPQLSKGGSLAVMLSAEQAAQPAELSSIDVGFGRGGLIPSGNAELRAWTRDGQVTLRPFVLSSLADNQYYHFALEGKRYVGMEIVSSDGDGVGIWNVRLGDAVQMACVVATDTSGHTTTTTGCPAGVAR